MQSISYNWQPQVTEWPSTSIDTLDLHSILYEWRQNIDQSRFYAPPVQHSQSLYTPILLFIIVLRRDNAIITMKSQPFLIFGYHIVLLDTSQRPLLQMEIHHQKPEQMTKTMQKHQMRSIFLCQLKSTINVDNVNFLRVLFILSNIRDSST